MNSRIGLRVTAYSEMGNRKYMEDVFSVAYQKSSDGKDLDFAYFGIFDGHGGDTAANFAKNHLMNFIVDQPGFWSENDEDITGAIKTGFIECHMAMWRDLDNWPPTNSGLPSTAGTTASIAFIRKGKIYVGHAGDSAIVLGSESLDCNKRWTAHQLTVDHKPENQEEKERIELCGGKVLEKQGIHRVVWYRPKYPHQGPIRRSTRVEEIPFLAVARSLGDLWSYNWKTEKFMVSPEPDVHVYDINSLKHKCLIFASDGLWNIIDPQTAVDLVYDVERNNVQSAMKNWKNPSRHLVEVALQKWYENKLRSDNTSVVCVMLDPPNKRNVSFGNLEQTENPRTIFDYSTSEAYNLDYIDLNTYQSGSIDNYMHPQNQSYPLYQSNSLPTFSSHYHQSYDQSASYAECSYTTSADLTYHTSSNESAFVKSCCPNERFLLANVNEQIPYHSSYEQHKEMYQNMAQQPFPPLHYAYKAVPRFESEFTLPSMIPGHGFLPSHQSFVTPRPMERYNYLRPTEDELRRLHGVEEEESMELEQDIPDTDTEDIEWSDEEQAQNAADQKAKRNEAETSGNDITREIMDQSNSNDDSIQIFEISSSNLDMKAENKNNIQAPEKSHNKENSETPMRKKRNIKSTKIGRVYETRLAYTRQMRSGNSSSLLQIRKPIGKEKNQRRIVRSVRKAVKTIQEVIKNTSASALKKVENISSATKASLSRSKDAKATDNNGATSRILRSSQTEAKEVQKPAEVKLLKTNVSRNLRSSTTLAEKASILKKRMGKLK